MTELTKTFNEITVKAGENFNITLPIGGFLGQSWNSVNVVKGSATLVQAPARSSGGCTGPFEATWTFKAEAAGDIEIVAKNRHGASSTFTVHVK